MTTLPNSWHRSVVTILDVLVRQARQQTPLTYQQLADEIGWQRPLPNLGEPLGTINLALHVLGKAWGEHIPPISALVVRTQDGLPGAGFAEFINRTPAQYAGLSRAERRRLVKPIQQAVYAYKKWDKVRHAVR